jgi:acetoacetyl-CoA synthetase
MSSRPIWTPSPERVAAANLTRFLQRTGHSDFASLYQWSVEKREEFWPAVWEFCGVVSSRGWQTVLIDGDKMPGARWFQGSRLNFAENLLRYDDEREALVYWTEAGRQTSLTYAELRRKTAVLAAKFRAWGVVPGDRVAGYLPNMPDTVIAMLAATSLGAIWSSCSPDFGVQAVLDRFGQIEPKVLVAAGDYVYGGRPHNYWERVEEIASRVASIEHVVRAPMELDGEAPLVFEQLPFDHPAYILYSSGTTGRPKCIVHGAGGTLVQHLKELVLHTDLRREDRICYFTTCGWMMWNWLVSSLAVGATVVLYDGSPFSPRKAMLWDLAEAERLTVFGTSAKYLSAAEKAALQPVKTHDLGKLRTILSTGSPLAPESFDYVYREVHSGVCLSSISGGTDIVSCFALGNPIAPVWRGELQTPGLGMKVEVFDEQGRPMKSGKGELVCTKAFPSMPVGFWKDDGGTTYNDAYFAVYPNVWRHGDWAEFTLHGGLIIHGRSDTVLNPGGVRIGTAEIYRIVEQAPDVLEALVIGQDWDRDVRVVLFVRLRDGVELDETLRAEIRRRIREGASPRHVPAKILQVADIPRTISGKISELAVRNVIHGLPVKNAEALANPESLDLFRDLVELRS